MTAYRIVFLDEDGEPLAESAIEQPDDASAIAHATGHPHALALQVWRGETTLVASLPPLPERGLSPKA